MAASTRAKLITKLHSELKKKYSLPPSQPSRPLLEHVLYACLLQDAPYDLADEGLAKCEQEFFDWNEVRVTTVTELTQVLVGMPDPPKTARRLKETLQAVFEEFYAFDLDHLKKENLGKAVGKFEAMEPVTPFVLSYTIQHGLGGHSIPIDYAAMVIMLSTGIASQAEASAGRIPGLERAIPKSKGLEFSALLHQAAVALLMDAKDKKARSLLNAVSKGSSDRYDEWEASKKAAIRRVKKRIREEKAAAEAAAEQAAEQAKAAAKTAGTKKGKSAAKKTAVKEPATKEPTAKPKSSQSKPKPQETAKEKTTKKTAKSTTKKPAAEKSTATKSSSTAKTKTTKKAAPKKAVKKTTKKAAKKTAASSSKTKTKKSAPKKSTGRKLSKRKPR